MNQGWECPKCERVYAPWMPECGDCKRRAAEPKRDEWEPYVHGPQGTEGTVWNGATWITYT